MNLHWAVDLAPRHKIGLPLTSRVLIASGISRLGHPQHCPYEMEGVGAVVTGPWTGPEEWPPYPILVRRPGGVLWVPPRPPHSIGRTLRRLSPLWTHESIALIAALAADEIPITREAARRLSREDSLAAILIEVGEEERAGNLLARVDVTREVSQVPLLVALPLHRVSDLTEPVCRAGADALVVGMPPMGVWQHQGGWVEGRLYGPLVLPLVLSALRKARSLAPDWPLVAQGGIHAPQDAVRCLEAGADAVALDAAVWVETDLPKRVDEAIRAWEQKQEENRSHQGGSHASSGPASE